MIRMPSAGEDFGRYHLLRELGRGGMGVVYVARDSHLDREVALKIIAPQLAGDDDYRARFRREAAALSRMDSQHVVQVHDHGEQDGCLFLVTQLVPGGDLLQRLSREGGLPPAVAIDLVMQVLAGLADAHRAGVVHRDVKPSNILLRQGVDRTEAFLCDFGIASTPGEQVTRTGALVGSFPYMAPERHQGQAAGIAGDIYSVGCVLWQVLTGTAPYAGTDVEIAVAHLQAPIPQLPETGSFAAAMNAVLRRALAKLPGDRYGSARAMRADLAAAVAMAPDQLALPASTQIRHSVLPGVVQAGAGATPSPLPRRRRAGVLAAAAVAGVLVIGVGTAVGLRDSPAAPQAGTGAGDPTDATTVIEVPGPSVVGGATFSAEPEASPPGERSGQSGTEGAEPSGGVPDATAGAGGSGSDGGGTRGGGGDDGRGNGTRGGSGQDDQRPPAPQPTASPSETPPPPPPATYRCWDGTETMGEEECSYPSGVAGLAWMFKDPRGCVQGSGSASRLTVLVCTLRTPKGDATLRYTHWSSVRGAKSALREEYGGRPSTWRDWGFRWTEESPRRRVVKRRVHLYADGPYSVTVLGESKRAFTSGLDAVRYRKPNNIRGKVIR